MGEVALRKSRFLLRGLIYSGTATAFVLPFGSSARALAPTDQETGQVETAAVKGPITDESDLEEIVVTATRREERLQEVPVTVTAVTGETLRNSGIANIRELTYVVPGYFGGRNFGSFQPVIRGVGSSGTNAIDESNVATYIDGVYQPSPYATWIDLAEVQRVEVLRGPQGTVFGRNATGGLINVITPDPSFELRGHTTLEAGIYTGSDATAPSFDFRGYVTDGLTDTVAADFSWVYRNQGDYIANLLDGPNYGGIEVLDLRSKILFEPSDRVRLVFTLGHFRQDSTVVAPQPIGGNTLGARYGAVVTRQPWQVALDLTPALDVVRYNAAFQTQFEFRGFNIETTTGYSHNELAQLADSDASNVFLGSLDIRTHPVETESLSNELRILSNDGGRFSWIVGGFAFMQDSRTFSILSSALINGIGNITGVSVTESDQLSTTRSYAGFAEGTYEIVGRLFLTLGGRYTTEERDVTPTLRVNGVLVPRPYGEGSFDRFTYRGALRYQWNPDSMVYASYGTGFKSGVFGGSVIATLIRPELLTATEVGIKSDPLPWLRTNFAAYYYDYTDLQVSARDPLSTGYTLQNAASAEIYGGELEFIALATDRLTFRGAIAYNHARYSSFPAAQAFLPRDGGGNITVTRDLSGNHVVRAPDFTANLSVNLRTDLGGGELALFANAFYSSRVYLDFTNTVSQDPYVMVSTQASWTTPDERWRFSLWARNLINEAVLQQVRVGALSTDGIYEAPRSIGIGVSRVF